MKNKKWILQVLVLTVVFSVFSMCSVSYFNVTHTMPDGTAVRQTFYLGETILIHLGGSFVTAIITKISGSAFTARFKGGGTGSFNKKKALKMPASSEKKK